MSSKSNIHGRAYEYACLRNLERQISKIRPCRIVQNSSLASAQRAWDVLPKEDKDIYNVSSLAAVSQLFELEPKITECSDDILEILIQADAKGKAGDVRDILIIRQSIAWEVGLSLKHNHFAVKHCRLSSRFMGRETKCTNRISLKRGITVQ